jgi:hypothetical protein
MFKRGSTGRYDALLWALLAVLLLGLAVTGVGMLSFMVA